MDELLVKCLEVIAPMVEMPVYGYFPGGDPRKFKPDEESCTTDELTRWKAACAEWEHGQGKDVGGPHLPLVENGQFVGHITVSPYGVGTYVLVDEEMASLAAELRAAIKKAGGQ